MMNRLPAFSVLLAMALLLTGCGYVKNSNTFRNRTYDYTNQEVINLPSPPQTPPDLTTPQFAPALNIPPGQNVYLPGNKPVMTPPGFNVNVPVPVLPPKSKLPESNS